MNEILWHCDNCVADFEGTDRSYICPRCKLRDIVEVYPINRNNEWIETDITTAMNILHNDDKSMIDIRKSRSEATRQANTLFETIESAIYQLEQLEPLLEMPDRGYVRNCFNAVIRTLKEGF